MDERSYGICFGLRDERISELSEELQEGMNLTVAFWPSPNSFRTAPQDLQASYKDRVRLVVLDASYIVGSQELIPLAGDSATLDERLAQVRMYFPSAQIVLITNRLATCSRQVNWQEDLLQPSYITSYGLAQNAGMSGVVATFKGFLTRFP